MNNSEAFYNDEYNNRARVPEFPQILEGWVQASRVARQTSMALLDLVYGETSAERLDLFPAKQDGAPLFVFIHGGYWRSLDKIDFSFVAPRLVAQGISVAVVNYALAPAVSIETITLQVARSIAWLWRNAERYGFDRNRIYVGGHSAGGHLTAMMMCTLWPVMGADLPPDLVKGGLPMSGLYDMDPIRQASFLNVDLKLDAASVKRLSPAYLPPATNAPVLTVVGGDESSEFLRQRALLEKHWPRSFRRDVPMPGFNHMTVCSELANPDSAVFKAAVALCRREVS